MTYKQRKKSAQEIQDEIFKKMSADEKIAFSSQLWQLAKDLAGKKILYGKTGSSPSNGSNRQTS